MVEVVALVFGGIGLVAGWAILDRRDRRAAVRYFDKLTDQSTMPLRWNEQPRDGRSTGSG